MALRLPPVLVAFIALLGLGFGCGSDGDSDGAGGGTSASSAQKEQFLEQATSLCQAVRKEASSRISFLSQGSDDASPATLAKRAVEQITVPGLEEEIAKLRALDSPPGDAPEVNALLAAIREVIDEARADPSKFVRGERPFAKAEKLANEYGLTSCGRL